MTYIALLRGINVGGHKSIKMADLAELMKSMKLQNVRTYVQSGNVVFDTDTSVAKDLETMIEYKLRQKYGFDVTTILRTGNQFAKIITNNPLLKQRELEPDKLHVTFLAAKPEAKLVAGLEIKQEKNEIYIVKGTEVYLYCPNGYGKSKLTNAVFEQKLKTAATTRNWRTTNTLLKMARG